MGGGNDNNRVSTVAASSGGGGGGNTPDGTSVRKKAAGGGDSNSNNSSSSSKPLSGVSTKAPYGGSGVNTNTNTNTHDEMMAIGGLVLRGNRCVLVRSLGGQWEGNRHRHRLTNTCMQRYIHTYIHTYTTLHTSYQYNTSIHPISTTHLINTRD